ncbi:type I restriction endonuclease subunit R [Zobellia amurskyensis]|uniref:type I site-specific deoxyribonuclease n=1 Tax=Zobellia amurskyensis TaxID=248905 RepID=A0A7X2ZR11_9FLAO|nr:type I restriction endonuclease [Zobellia amurskyensis]MUH34802.1 type I restriction endonuclease subunit R [Zobellia amurskyensis]
MSQSPEYIHSELPAIKLFQQMGYQYFDASQKDERTDITEVILKDRLLAAIKRLNTWINDNNLNKAYNEITTVTGASLMEINEKVWELIKGGTFSVKQTIDGVEEFKVVHFIDYLHPENNDFLVVNQMKYHGRYQHSIPDLVVYINGLPIGVIECKSPTAQNAWDKAYSDLKYYQENSEKLFHYNQICAGIWDVGGRYGAINSPQQFYSVFKTSKEDTDIINQAKKDQDKLIIALFKKERVLDIIRHFVLFELEEGSTVKKLPRYQQLRATNKTIARLQGGEGGVVWHTQGSGKSLTMAYVTRKLQAPEYGFDNPTVLIMTDRKDLDRQITTTFQNVGFKNVNQASSVVHLDKLLRNDYGGIITTTLQKFQETDKDATTSTDQTELEERGNLMIEKHLNEKTLTKITKELQKGKWVEIERVEIELEELSKKENLYILVDEAHRSHYGFLASFMRTVLPNAKFVAFTGTPISKEDKSTLAEFYGGKYIDVYTIMESVADGATVELLYDEGIAKLDVKKEELDQEFEETFGHLSEDKKDKLKREALRKYQLSAERIDAIGRHMVDHYRDKIFPDGHKAMIVCSGREAAIKYQEVLESLKSEGYHNFDSKVVISMGSPKSDSIAKTYYETLEWNKENPNDKRPVLVVPPEDIKNATNDFKLPFGDAAEKEKSGKKKHDNTAFIIVSDMLLTGWDAPIASCLYLDKPLKEHNLLQAIARVNRSRKGKNAGYIVDYNGITAYLIQALEIFSGDIRPDDILKNINEEFPKLEMNHTKLVDFFKPMKIDRNYNREDYIDAAVRFIEPINKRDDFKVLLKDFNKSINIVLPNTKALKYQGDFKLFNEIKLRARNAYPEDEELKITKDESKMLQSMIDEHLKAQGVESLLAEPISIIDKDKFKEEIMNASPATKELKMRNNLKHTIKVGIDKNPDFYKPLAQRLDELLKMKTEQRITQLELLKAYTDIQDEIIDQQKEGEQKGFVTERERAVYDSMKVLFGEDAEDATKTIFDLIKGELDIVGWQRKGQVKKDIENKIRRYLTTAKIDREDAKMKAKEMVEVLIKNKDA